VKSGAERIYRINVRLFQSLAEEKLRARITLPQTGTAAPSMAQAASEMRMAAD
jgi:hypothetical protein